MIKAPGAVMSHPRLAIPPMLAIVVGIMKMPAPIMFPATSMVAGKSPIRFSLGVMRRAPSGERFLLGNRLKQNLALNRGRFLTEIPRQKPRKIRRRIESGQDAIDQEPESRITALHRDAIRLTRE